MDIGIGNRCILVDEKWEKMESYTVIDVQPDNVTLRLSGDSFNTGPPVTIKQTDRDRIFVSPFQAEVYRSNPAAFGVAAIVDDLIGALLGQRNRILISDLIDELKGDHRLSKIPREFIEGCIRLGVVSKDFEVFADGRKKDPPVYLELSTHRKAQERDRIFAASFAFELQALSKRIRSLISHTGSVGTYREGLLQTLLRKSLPERYHVATGFIHGCSRQLDVVIYDRIDYAPLFREGDLVVVPPESVRAVIEVKTDLTAANIRDSLSLLDEVAYFDDLNPPFFKGVFAFESSIAAQQIYSSVENFYDKELPDSFAEIDKLEEENWPNIITEPFRHVSSVCVLGHAYAQVNFVRNQNDHYVPVLMHASSVSGLAAQAAYFLQHLLAYLKFDALKATESPAMGRLLGADTRWERYGNLVDTSSWSWGPYFQRDEMDEGEEVVAEMEKHVDAVKQWLDGASWRSKLYRH